MTKEQHIDYWMITAEEDWITAGVLFSMDRFLHSLNWAHSMLEKFARALWVKHNSDDTPPSTHNIVMLLQDAKVELSDEMTAFLANFECYQACTRCPNFSKKVYMSCTQDFTRRELEKVKEVRTYLLNMLP